MSSVGRRGFLGVASGVVAAAIVPFKAVAFTPEAIKKRNKEKPGSLLPHFVLECEEGNIFGPPVKEVRWNEEELKVEFIFHEMWPDPDLRLTVKAFAFYDRDGKLFSRRPMHFDINKKIRNVLQLTYYINTVETDKDPSPNRPLNVWIGKSLYEAMKRELS